MATIKKRLPALDYIRAIAMLGVIGIHVGSFSLMNPDVSIHLIALFEVVSRFSVPIFFFVSAFGLFYQLDLSAPFSYRDFLSRRLRTVLVPYLVWSCLYLVHYSLIVKDLSMWQPGVLLSTLFFGQGCYHLYFMVILLWFYALMPLWIAIVRRMTKPILAMTVLFVLQVLFNQWSTTDLWTFSSPSPLLNRFVELRLNYWTAHYLFIFLLGAVFSVHYDAVYAWLRKHSRIVFAVGFGSLVYILGSYYHFLSLTPPYSPESAINTVQQLSLPGLIYTFGSAVFFFRFFTFTQLPNIATRTLASLGAHSYFIYLFHPFALSVLGSILINRGIVLTTKKTLLFYLVILAVSYIMALIINRINKHFPLVGMLLNGSKMKKKTA